MSAPEVPAEGASSSDAALVHERPLSRPWREPKLVMPNGEQVSNLADLVDSPRFREASLRYGIHDPKSLLPRDPSSKESTGGVEANLLARQEKRRLVDLGGVLMERQRAMDQEVERQQTSVAGRVRVSEPRPNSAVSAPGAGAGPSSAAEAAEQSDPVILQAKRWIYEEKKRTKSELIALVEDEARRDVLREAELQKQSGLAAEAVRQRIEEDAVRRKRNADFRNKIKTRQDSLYGALGRTLEERRQKQQKEDADHAARMAARASLAEQELKRREAADAAHAKEIAERIRMQREAADAMVLRRHEEAERRFKEKAEARAAARWTPVGKVVPVLEGPTGAKIAAVKQREKERRERKILEMEAKLEADRIRVQENAQMRSVGLALRKEASRLRMKQFAASKAQMAETNENFKQSTLSRIEHGSKSVDSLHTTTERMIKEKRQLSMARDKEKERCVERVDRARDFRIVQTMQNQKAMEGRVEELQSKRRLVASASRERVAHIHYTALHLKESLALSTVDSIRTLKQNTGLLSKLGVDVNELEQASQTYAQNLTTSLSAPHIRPATAGATAGSGKKKAITRVSGHVVST